MVNDAILRPPSANYINTSSRFLLQNRQFKQQYSHIYYVRLQSQRDELTEIAVSKWGRQLPVKRLHELTGDADTCIVIGTIYKHMEMKPSILKELSEELNLAPEPVLDKYVTGKDILILEDNLQRINLVGDNQQLTGLVTGVIIAVMGRQTTKGNFDVDEICFPTPSLQVLQPLLQEDKYVLLLSGLGIGKNTDSTFSLQLLIDAIRGNFGFEDDESDCFLSKICRVIIAGNCIHKETANEKEMLKHPHKQLKFDEHLEAIKTLDILFAQLATTVDLDIMPGETDPVTYMMPQQPFHSCLFPKTAEFATAKLVTNPYEFSLDGVTFLGTSGQTVKDVYSFSKLESPLEIMSLTLDWGHMAPSCPDTLSCHPFTEEDPFILKCLPHVYFVGDQKRFETKMYDNGLGKGQKTRIICIPSYCKTGMAALLNLRDLSVEPFAVNN